MERNKVTIGSTFKDVGYLVKIGAKAGVAGLSFVTGGTSFLADSTRSYVVGNPDGFIAELDRKSVKRLAGDYHSLGYRGCQSLTGLDDVRDEKAVKRDLEV